MYDFIETYLESDIVEDILKSNEYIKFTVNECTIEALNKKADFINACHNNTLTPLCIVYHHTVGVYDKIFYIKK